MRKPSLALLLPLSSLRLAFRATRSSQPNFPRIGYLAGSSASASPSARSEAFRQGLRELGYVEGQNIVIEWRSAEGKAARLPGLRPSWSGSRWM